MTLQLQTSHEYEFNLDKIHHLLTDVINKSSSDFFYAADDSTLLTEVKNAFAKFGLKKFFVHVGIGGSSLGPEMLVSALQNNSTQFQFINNIDPDEICDQLSKIDLSDALFYFVSKSGGTAETLATLSIITNYLLKNGINESELSHYFVFATDPDKSELLEIGKKLNITCLKIPSKVGGRFSVLTAVGFFPALYAGIDIEKMLKGIKLAQTNLLDKNSSNPLFVVTEMIYHLKKQQNISNTVLMPYSSKLKNTSAWFAQLWAESLGKKYNLKNEVVFEGLSPITAYGATDQHSQMQLFLEGPKDKLIIFIEVLNFKNDYSLNSSLNSPALSKLSKFNLTDLLKAELYGTIKAVKKSDRPYIHLKIDRVDEENLAELILFLETLTALVGYKLNVDPFNQPGVEAGKIYAFEFLSQLN